MSGSLLWTDFIAYSLQVGLLVGIAGWLPSALWMRSPKARLMFWHVLLAACLVIPLVQPWRSEVITTAVQVAAGPTIVVTPSVVPHARHISLAEIALVILIAGCLARLGLLAIGFLRLRRYRRNSIPFEPAPAWSVEADLRLSSEIASPVTFGLIKPVVLLPANFVDFDASLQEAILCHEILHVRRRDWLAMLMEELIRAGLWFHPAIWWLLGEIQLAREQTVDRAAIEMTKAQEQYVDALLVVAGAAMQLDLAPAPLFLRKRQLKQRVVSILKETRMSTTRNMLSLAAGVAMVAGACWFVTTAFPLSAAPQSVTDAAGVSVNMQGARLMHRTPIAYPRNAQLEGIQGIVLAQVTIDGSGNVSDASILSGPDQLRKSVLQSVLGWHFTKDAAGGSRQIAITFRLPDPLPAGVSGGVVGGVSGGTLGGILGSVPSGAPAGVQRGVLSSRVINDAPSASDVKRVVRAITVSGIDLPADEVLAKLPLHVNDEWRPESFPQLIEAVHQIDEHLNVYTESIPPNGIALRISAPNAPPPPVMNAATQPIVYPDVIPVGGAVQNQKLIAKVDPTYPQIAKEARISGTIELAALIGPDGHIRELKVISGHPLMRQAALDAVRQWVYSPTLLNNQPVAVSTTIDVIFTLSQ